MTEERKRAILFAATLLCARKLMDMESDKCSPTKLYIVERAISQAAFYYGKNRCEMAQNGMKCQIDTRVRAPQLVATHSQLRAPR